jgi:hypothetical protein
MDIKKIKVPHPEFGKVTFTGLTIRQRDIIEAYADIIRLKKEHPNDQMLGAAVRNKVRK